MPVGIAFEKNFIASLSSLDSTFLIVKNNSYDFFLFERQSMCVESTWEIACIRQPQCVNTDWGNVYKKENKQLDQQGELYTEYRKRERDVYKFVTN